MSIHKAVNSVRGECLSLFLECDRNNSFKSPLVTRVCTISVVKIIHREVLFSVNWLSLTLFYRRTSFLYGFYSFTQNILHSQYLLRGPKYIFNLLLSVITLKY